MSINVHNPLRGQRRQQPQQQPQRTPAGPQPTTHRRELSVRCLSPVAVDQLPPDHFHRRSHRHTQLSPLTRLHSRPCPSFSAEPCLSTPRVHADEHTSTKGEVDLTRVPVLLLSGGVGTGATFVPNPTFNLVRQITFVFCAASTDQYSQRRLVVDGRGSKLRP